MIKQIKLNDKLIAMLVDNRDIEDGTHPVTDPSGSLQMLMMKRKKGHVFLKHTHKLLERTSNILQEVVVVTEGELIVTVCTRDGVDVGKYSVIRGQCLFLVDGGYKIEVKEDAAFFEFKNGPHFDDKVLL
jgi:anti-sigma factor ChrR (cupin superfamily)